MFVMRDQLGQIRDSLAQNKTHFKLDETPYIGQTVRTTARPEWHQNPFTKTRGQNSVDLARDKLWQNARRKRNVLQRR
jgi:hypothetical protein